MRRHRRLKRICARPLVALVVSLASVFLVGVINPAAVHAEALFAAPTGISPLEESQVQLQQLSITFKTKAQLIEEKAAEVKQAEAEVAQVAEKKEDVAAQVASIKDEVAQLQAQLAEKKRLEALRIVPQSQYAVDSAGNSYTPGNCTYYVKSKRPDLSNGLGNANTWYYRAQLLGYKTGTMAKTGAIGVDTGGWLGHVVYVEKWLGNGQMLISEMNTNGLWSTDTRVANESEFVYIYELP